MLDENTITTAYQVDQINRSLGRSKDADAMDMIEGRIRWSLKTAKRRCAAQSTGNVGARHPQPSFDDGTSAPDRSSTRAMV